MQDKKEEYAKTIMREGLPFLKAGITGDTNRESMVEKMWVVRHVLKG